MLVNKKWNYLEMGERRSKPNKYQRIQWNKKISLLLYISLSKSVIGVILGRFSPVLNRDVVKYSGLYSVDF